jgi:hypothetical protein
MCTTSSCLSSVPVSQRVEGPAMVTEVTHLYLD